METINVLRASELLRNLPDAALELLLSRARTNAFRGGQVIFDKGADGDSLHIVASGSVEIRRQASDKVVLATISEGQSFGELSVFDPKPRSAAAVCVVNTTTIEVSRADLREVFANDPDAAMAVAGSMARSTTEAKEEVTLFNQVLDQRVRERTEEVRETQLEVIRRLGRAAEFRDDDTGEHIYRMSHYAGALAKAVGFDDAATERLLIAAPMHDIGKIGIPDRILLKPGKLDDEEWEIMRSHSFMGAQMLSGSRSDAIRLAKRIALQHHERWDGRGYPDGLKADSISLEARVCTVADVFDALTSKRPYKEPWTVDDALAEIERCGGSMFDPDLAIAFVGLEDQLREIRQASSLVPKVADVDVYDEP